MLVSVIKGEFIGVVLIFVNGEGENVIGIYVGVNVVLLLVLVDV